MKPRVYCCFAVANVMGNLSRRRLCSEVSQEFTNTATNIIHAFIANDLCIVPMLMWDWDREPSYYWNDSVPLGRETIALQEHGNTNEKRITQINSSFILNRKNLRMARVSLTSYHYENARTWPPSPSTPEIAGWTVFSGSVAGS